jgi:hypothetical protein
VDAFGKKEGLGFSYRNTIGKMKRQMKTLKKTSEDDQKNQNNGRCEK